VNKKSVLEALQKEIHRNLELALAAAQNTYDIATHEDSKAENKYDTRGLEASYLAGAQALRVADLRDTLALVANFNAKDFSDSDKLALGALVELHSGNKKIWVLLLQKGGGQSAVIDSKQVQIVTPESPLGLQLIGKEVGDEFKISNRDYEITAVF
jgi:transcription elongation GreA/GreB family factor